MSKEKRETRPVSFRVTEDDYRALTSQAGRAGLGAFIRKRLFDTKADSRQIRVPRTNEIILARLLSELGQSGIAPSLRDLAEAARVGALVATPEIEAEIKRACDNIQRLRSDLILALGLKLGACGDDPER